MTGCLKGDQEVVRLENSPSPSTEKHLSIKERRKNGTDQHDKDQQKTEKGLTIGHLECTTTVQIRSRDVLGSKSLRGNRIYKGNKDIAKKPHIALKKPQFH
jgi:hypothetical protein